MSIVFNDGSNGVSFDSSASWTDFRPSLNSLYHLLMLILLEHLSPNIFFSNIIVSLSIFSSRIQNSMLTCSLVFKFIFFFDLNNTPSCTYNFFNSVEKPHYSSYNACSNVEWCKKHSSLQEYRCCTHIIHPYSFHHHPKIQAVVRQGLAARL